MLLKLVPELAKSSSGNATDEAAAIVPLHRARCLPGVGLKPIRKSVFPVAGLGTRFLPATKSIPKKMLPVVDKPLIQYAVEEALDAGIDTLIFITSRNKHAISDHFDSAFELQVRLSD